MAFDNDLSLVPFPFSIIYILDLIRSTNKLSFILFVDDTNLFSSGKDIKKVEPSVNDELPNVEECKSHKKQI